MEIFAVYLLLLIAFPTKTTGNVAGTTWTGIEGRLKEIALGDGKIVGVNSADQIYLRRGLSSSKPWGTYWQHLDGSLKYVDSGDGKIGGVNREDKIYFRQGITSSRPGGSGWQEIDGRLKQLSIGDGKIIGCNSGDDIWARTGITAQNPFGTGWRQLDGKLKHISVGDGKIIGVNSGDQIWFRTGVDDSNPFGTGWRQLDGRLKQIDVGDGKIIGVNSGDVIYIRTGVTSANPSGSSWQQLDGRLKHVTVGDGRIMGVNNGDVIYFRAGVTSGTSSTGNTGSTGGTTGGGGSTGPGAIDPLLLAGDIFGKEESRIQDYVNYTILVNDNLGETIDRANFAPALSCPQGKGVTGFRIKMIDSVDEDETQLTGVEMVCQDGTTLGPIETDSGGVWKQWRYCDGVAKVDTPNFVVGFNYRSLEGHGGTQLKMKCSNVVDLGPSGANKGDWSLPGYSGCSTSAKFCGFAVEKSDKQIGRMKFLCCSPATSGLLGNAEWKPYGRDICIGGKGENYGFFRMPQSGFLKAMKFEYIDGQLSCNENEPGVESRFGCNYPHLKRAFSIYVTTDDKAVILPDSNSQHPGNHHFYMVLGLDGRKADEFTLLAANPTRVNENDEIRIWYGEDLTNGGDQDNGDQKVCVNVYGKML